MVLNEKNRPIELLIENILDTRYDNLSDDNILNAKNRLLDVIGCAIGGAWAEGNEQLVDLVKDWGGKPEATIMVHGGKVPALNAALVNSVMARSFDFEALGPLFEGRSIPAHVSGTTVITTLVMGELCEASGKELITALLTGDDLSVRILAATGSESLPLGWDSVGTLNSFGATAIAGRLLRLDTQQMKDALGLVLNQMSGTMQNIWDGVPAFKLLQGLSARNGIFSAQLAKTGWAGPDDPLLGKNGYFDLFTQGCADPDILTRDLGIKYYSDAHFKPHSCCAVSHPAIDCAISLVNKFDIKTSNIKEIILYVSDAGLNSFLARPFKIGKFPHADGAFNYRYPIAVALLKGSVSPEHFSEEAVRDPETGSLIQKIRLSPLPGVERELLRARLEITTDTGQRFEETTEHPRGEPLNNPLSKDEIISKFMANAALSRNISTEKSEKILSFIDNIEEMDNIKELFQLLV
jgi:2-methylcitrate dehydratase PrpD